MKGYIVDGQYVVLAETAGQAKSKIERRYGIPFNTLRAVRFTQDERMQENRIYEKVCETCGQPCDWQYCDDDLYDPHRSQKARCEHCK